MPSKYWIKLYHEILGDPKMALLSDRMWRRTIECFLMAGEVDDGGTLPPLDQIAWTVRLSEDKALEELAELEKRGTVKFNADADRWFVTHFAARQEVATNAERMRRYRAKLRSCNDPVTSDEGDKIRKEEDKIRTASPSASRENPYGVDENGRPVYYPEMPSEELTRITIGGKMTGEEIDLWMQTSERLRRARGAKK